MKIGMTEIQGNDKKKGEIMVKSPHVRNGTPKKKAIHQVEGNIP